MFYSKAEYDYVVEGTNKSPLFPPFSRPVSKTLLRLSLVEVSSASKTPGNKYLLELLTSGRGIKNFGQMAGLTKLLSLAVRGLNKLVGRDCQ